MAAQYRSPLIGFLLGMVVTSVIQSSPTVTVVAMAMGSSGLLEFSTAVWIVVGASQGAGIATWVTGRSLDGSARQLVLYQVILKTVGVALVSILLWLEMWLFPGSLAQLFDFLHMGFTQQLAATYVMLQVISDIGLHFVEHRVTDWLDRQAPQSVVEKAGQPLYLNDQSLDEAVTALMLLDLEQQRLLQGLLVYLNDVREDGGASHERLDAYHMGSTQLARLCHQFVTEVMDRHNSRTVLDRALTLRDRNDLLGSLQGSLMEMHAPLLRLQSDATTRGLMHSMVEGLHLMLSTLIEVAHRYDADDVELLRMLTHDRAELMDSIRRSAEFQALDGVAQGDFYQVTTLFERMVWLLRRYVMALNVTRVEPVNA